MKITAKFREYENNHTKGFVDFTVNGSIGIKGATLVEGKNGLFVSMPQRKVGDEFRDVVSGVSKEFAEQLLEATIAAWDSEEKKATIGDAGKPYYEPHVTGLDNPDGKIKALACLTVRESQDAEKSSFTVNDIRVIQVDKNLFLGMPNVKTDNEKFPYNDLVYLTGGSETFLTNLIIGKAMDELGIEKKSPSLKDRVEDAKARASEKPKASDEKEPAKTKNEDIVH